MTKIIVNTDGGARGNPGPAGVGVVIAQNDGETIKEIDEYIGEATNNQAEYMALIKALNWLIDNNIDCNLMEFRLDSELVVKQINGEYKIKNEGLKPLLEDVMDLIAKIGIECKFIHVRREQNKRADWLVNKAIDGVVG